ncbi:MAG: 30S ribosomal protein S8 [Bacteroidota bacterium]|nr:30S ribosomal protein S8 [Bacteroidota bacterium]
MDSIGDFLTRIRNASMAGHRILEVPSSRFKKELTKVLFDKGYILNFKFEEADDKHPTIKIALKYNAQNKKSTITSIERVSKPGLRKYVHTEKLPRVLNGLGIAVVSTSKGLMTDKEAREQKIGGEVVCYVY